MLSAATGTEAGAEAGAEAATVCSADCQARLGCWLLFGDLFLICTLLPRSTGHTLCSNWVCVCPQCVCTCVCEWVLFVCLSVTTLSAWVQCTPVAASLASLCPKRADSCAASSGCRLPAAAIPPSTFPLSAPTYRLAQHTHTHTHIPILASLRQLSAFRMAAFLGLQQCHRLLASLLPPLLPPLLLVYGRCQINWLFRHWAASICLTTHFLNSRTPFAASLSLLSLSPSFTCHKVVWQSSWNSPANGFVATSQVLGATRLPRALTPTPWNPPSPSWP